QIIQKRPSAGLRSRFEAASRAPRSVNSHDQGSSPCISRMSATSRSRSSVEASRSITFCTFIVELWICTIWDVHHHWIVTGFLVAALTESFAAGSNTKADRVIVVKHERTLTLMSGSTVLKSYKV